MKIKVKMIKEEMDKQPMEEMDKRSMEEMDKRQTGEMEMEIMRMPGLFLFKLSKNNTTEKNYNLKL